MSIRTVDKYVATTPFPSRDIQTSTERGFTRVVQKSELTRLKVVADSDFGVCEGDFIYVFGEDAKLPYAAKVFSGRGGQYILVPSDRIVMLENQD